MEIKKRFSAVTRWVAFISVLARNTHKGAEREPGSGRGKEGPREDGGQKRTVGVR